MKDSDKDNKAFDDYYNKMDEKMCPLLTAAIWLRSRGIGIEPCRGENCMWYEMCILCRQSAKHAGVKLQSAGVPNRNAPDDEG